MPEQPVYIICREAFAAKGVARTIVREMQVQGIQVSDVLMAVCPDLATARKTLDFEAWRVEYEPMSPRFSLLPNPPEAPRPISFENGAEDLERFIVEVLDGMVSTGGLLLLEANMLQAGGRAFPHPDVFRAWQERQRRIGARYLNAMVLLMHNVGPSGTGADRNLIVPEMYAGCDFIYHEHLEKDDFRALPERVARAVRQYRGNREIIGTLPLDNPQEGTIPKVPEMRPRESLEGRGGIRPRETGSPPSRPRTGRSPGMRPRNK